MEAEVRKMEAFWPVHFLKRALIQLLSFESIFVLFLFAGLLKEDRRFDGLPLDLTVIVLIVNLAQGAYILLFRKHRFSRFSLSLLSLILIFMSWVLFSLLWTPSVEYGPDKAARIVLLGTWAFVGTAFIIGNDALRTRRFYVATLLFAVWMAVESIALYFSQASSKALATFGGHYIGVGRTMGYGICIAAIWLIRSSRIGPRLVYGSLFIAFVFVAMVAGARGPVLATLLALLVPFARVRRVLSGYIDRLHWRYILLGLSLFAVLFVVASTIVVSRVSTPTIQRFTVLFTQEGGGSSASGRTSRFKHALAQVGASPIIGGGIGSFPVKKGVADAREYPHNIILEILAELGVVGLILWLGPLLVLFWPLSVRGLDGMSKESGVHMLAVMFFVSSMANAMVSGDLDSNRWVFVSAGLLAAVITSPPEQNRSLLGK